MLAVEPEPENEQSQNPKNPNQRRRRHKDEWEAEGEALEEQYPDGVPLEVLMDYMGRDPSNPVEDRSILDAAGDFLETIKTNSLIALKI